MNTQLKQKPKTIIFDWDGTLANTRPLVVRAMEQVLSNYDLDNWDTIKAKKRDTTKSLKENFSNFFGENEKEAYQLYLKYYIDNFKGLNALPGVQKTLKYLSSLDIYLCIASNKEKLLLEKEVDYLFPNIVFYEILGNGDVSYNKPHPAPALDIINKTNVDLKKDTIWLVGDSKQDTECAYASKCLPIIIGKGSFMDSNYIKSKQNACYELTIFKGFNEFLEWIKINH